MIKELQKKGRNIWMSSDDDDTEDTIDRIVSETALAVLDRLLERPMRIESNGDIFQAVTIQTINHLKQEIKDNE